MPLPPVFPVLLAASAATISLLRERSYSPNATSFNHRYHIPFDAGFCCSSVTKACIKSVKKYYYFTIVPTAGSCRHYRQQHSCCYHIIWATQAIASSSVCYFFQYKRKELPSRCQMNILLWLSIYPVFGPILSNFSIQIISYLPPGVRKSSTGSFTYYENGLISLCVPI